MVGELRPGADFDETGHYQHVRGQLAGYESTKRLIPVARMHRAPNGKTDSKAARSLALQTFSMTSLT